MKLPIEKGFAATDLDHGSMIITAIGETREDAMEWHRGQRGMTTTPVIVMPAEIEDIEDSALESVAKAMCISYERVNPNQPSGVIPGEPKWMEYRELARAAVIGLQAAVEEQ